MAAPASGSQDALQQVQTFKAAFASLEAQLESFLAVSQKDLDTQLQPVLRASVQLALAQATQAVFLCYLRAAGVAEASQAGKAAERVRLYEKKVRKLESEAWLAQNSAQTQVNVAAANRFISAAIPDLTLAQRAALKAAASRTREQARQRPAKPGGKRKASAAEEAEAFLAKELDGGVGVAEGRAPATAL
ncbi:hypothetical protein WJX81_004667 [Elliptochloris bilobata]|uniref:Nuclear nucleic acid-binding protein C1D n=1 Tax=Elliptochloris bilobata TaxID=381761 RepID=A0AAW1S152_9CHLO